MGLKSKDRSAPWFTETIGLMVKLLEEAFSRCKTFGSSVHSYYYEKLRDYTIFVIQNEKNGYLHQLENIKLTLSPWRELGRMGIA